MSRIVARYGRLNLLCLDELGYVQLDARGAELLFEVITEREERGAVACGSNQPFSEWGSVIPDPRLVVAIVDRLTFNAHIIETGTESYPYRLQATEATKGRKKRADAVHRPVSEAAETSLLVLSVHRAIGVGVPPSRGA